jgi:3-isopropylmalate/(R)-2-methylmalate dehydratase large subunit
LSPPEAPASLGERLGRPPRVLYLTRDPELLRRQLAGVRLTFDAKRELLDDVSTDEIVPAHACYYYDERIAPFVYTGLRGGHVPLGAVQRGAFDVVVSGRSKGSGSSREAAPFAEIQAGIRLVVAASIEKIYRQNCHNIGLLTTTDFSILERLERGEAVAVDELLADLDAVSVEIVRRGGLFAYNRARAEGRVALVPRSASPRAMTAAEKILAAHAVSAPEGDVFAVKPGDSLFVRTDVRFSHEYVTPMADALFRRGFGEDAALTEPGSILTFRDHLTLLERVMPEEHRRMGLDVQAASLASEQEAFAKRHGLRLYGEARRGGVPSGSEGICHNKIVEEVALPGQIVVGTDSHTCTAGAVGALAFGIGSTDMANAWFTNDVRVAVPRTVRIELRGRLSPAACAKDVMLHLLSLPAFREGRFIGHVFEFGGEGVATLPVDERATLANMAVEGGGFTGLVEVDEAAIAWLAASRGLSEREVRARVVRSDEDASYADLVEIDLRRIEPMVALPGDPRNAVPLSRFRADHGDVRIDIAYGGSCAGSKATDMDLYARVLSEALERGLRTAEGVRLYLQFGSQDVRRYAEGRGYRALFESVGATLLDPACGACIRAGPGISDRPDQVTVSAASRNYPGRSGPGRVYLASPLVVAASAVAGYLIDPETLFADTGVGKRP